MRILRGLKARFWKRTKLSSDVYYLDVNDFPLSNWDKCIAGDLRHVTKSGKNTKFDGVVWVSLYNQYLEIFGLDQTLSDYLDVKLLLIELRCLFVESGNRMLLNQIAIEEINLEQLDPSKHEGMTTDQCLVHLSKMQGYRINKSKITIIEFKNLMLEYVRVNK